MPKLVTTLIAILSIFNSFAQSAKEQLTLINAVTLQESNFFETFTYQDKFGYIIVPAQIGKKTYEYIFDTGGYNTLTSEIMEDQNLPILMEVEVGSSNQLKSTISMTKIPNIRIGNVNFKGVGALNFDFNESPQISCYTNGGLIGKSLIKEAVWQINSVDKNIIVTDQLNKLDHIANATKLKVKFDKTYNPFIKAKINGKTFTFLLDFGFDGIIALTENDAQKVTSESEIEVTGEGSISANGVVKESTFIKDIETFTIGGEDFPNQWLYYSQSKNYNLIGAALTKHFIFTLNFKEKELYLSPIRQEIKTEPRKSFGFALEKKEDVIYVRNIFKGQAAEKAGLQLNDTIISVNGNSFTNSLYCEFYDFMQELLEKDQPILLKVKRAQEIFEIKIAKSTLL